MRILIIDTYYPAFLYSLYNNYSDLTHKSYSEQWGILMEQCFGVADFYSRNLNELGHEATEIVANCEPLQRQWSQENGLKMEKGSWVLGRRARLIPWPQRTHATDWLSHVLIAQVKRYQPDVLHIQDMNDTSPDLLRELRPYVKLITGQIACPIAPNSDFREYDLVLSSFPHFVEQFRRDGLPSEYFNLGFEPKILERLEDSEHHQVVFVGGLSTNHDERIRFLEKIAASQRLDIWGYGADNLSDQSPLRKSHHGEAWALRMYEVLSASDISLNHHINVSGRFANNMRLYEATGVGTLLLTEYKDNIRDLFEPGKEIVVYHSAEECIELIEHYLSHKEERRLIAQAGQARTLREHTYRCRMQEFTDIVKDYF